MHTVDLTNEKSHAYYLLFIHFLKQPKETRLPNALLWNLSSRPNVSHIEVEFKGNYS